MCTNQSAIDSTNHATSDQTDISTFVYAVIPANFCTLYSTKCTANTATA